MMTILEFKLSEVKWICCGDHFTTVVNGLGFVLYQKCQQMQLAGLSQKEVINRKKVHKTIESLEVICYWDGHFHCPTLFDIHVSNDLVSAVILSTFPEILK